MTRFVDGLWAFFLMALILFNKSHTLAFVQQYDFNSIAVDQSRTRLAASDTVQAEPQQAAADDDEQEEEEEHWLDYLKFGGSTPSFDVIAKTKEYVAEPGYRSFTLRNIPTDYYDTDYIFRGPIIGPINRQDLVATNTAFGLDATFPDLDRQPFGFCVDPENPYRCLFFERWTATNTGDLELKVPAPLSSLTAPATGKKIVTPVMPFSITWTPQGKIIYEVLTTAMDRFEGNTRGKVAVFGLLHAIGLPLPDNQIGNPLLIVQQKLGRALVPDGGAPVTYSKPESLPGWWKSKAVAAERNDM